MKVIDIPEAVKFPVIFDGKEDKESFAFVDFIRSALHQYEPLGQGAANIRQAMQIHEKIDTVKDAKSVEFGEADFTVVKAAIDKAKWKPIYARYLVPYFDAMDKVQDVKAPVETKPDTKLKKVE